MNLIAGINPVARLLSMLMMTTPVLLTLDWVSAVVALVCIVLGAPLVGVGWGRLVKRSWPIFVAAPLAAVPMALYGRPGGETYAQFWLIQVTDNSLQLALAMGLRVLAVGLPVIVLSADVDPTDLGDGLAQNLKLPPRFVIGTVAALRMLGLLRDDIDAMRRSRRARGLAEVGRMTYWWSIVFGLLVMALRRASKLATAMEARGFGRVDTQRTFARTARFGGQEWAFVITCALIGLGAVAVSILTGHFMFLGAV
ncbi:energy-coupling factor transporter transmembrane component T family protein [Corynebacterium cystitidis]|uniref:energy-coupling factor transporter transmembrane component T family protein n=1 Tax=Corynebacterium cystitidis TaxID=35757 RepID=UPI00211E79D1|nr:energy-coupling factor transporter transmembrane component T [Corynebacterium cystitidis]